MAQNPTAELKQDTATDGSVIDNLKAGVSHLAERGATAASDAMDAGRDYVSRVRDAGQDYAGRLYETGNRKAEEAAFYADLVLQLHFHGCFMR